MYHLMGYVLLSLVAVLFSLIPVFTERRSLRNWLAGCLMVLGAFLVAGAIVVGIVLVSR